MIHRFAWNDQKTYGYNNKSAVKKNFSSNFRSLGWEKSDYSRFIEEITTKTIDIISDETSVENSIQILNTRSKF